MYNNKHKDKKGLKKKGKAVATLSGDVKMPLTGFRATFVPDVESIKLVYSDYRVITASVNQAEYVYRLNSLFDPDVTGVGGQPDGFDFWKTYYTIYRVVAAKVEVQAVSNTIDGNGLLAIAATDASGAYLSAEEVAGLRKSKAQTFSQQQRASVSAMWHIGELMGRNDDSILADNECAALMAANPTNTQYLHVAIESGNSAAQATMVWTKITYYARFERAIATLDSATRHRLRFQRALLQAAACPSSDCVTAGEFASVTERAPLDKASALESLGAAAPNGGQGQVAAAPGCHARVGTVSLASGQLSAVLAPGLARGGHVDPPACCPVCVQNNACSSSLSTTVGAREH